MLTTWILQCKKDTSGFLASAIYIEFWSQHDIDSLIKPILDSLQRAGIIQNDKQITKLTIIKKQLDTDPKKCYIKVDVRSD